MNIELNISKQNFTPKHFPYLFDYSHRWECYMGSSGSGKSYFIVLKLIIRACNEKIRILCCRRYGTTLRNTVFSLFKEVITKWKLTQYVKINESNMLIKFPNGSEIIFTGLDEETKLLSLNDIGTVFVEEAYEVPLSIVELLSLRMRGHNENQLIIMAWNPISKNSWLHDFCEVNPPESFVYIHSTYKDNPFLPEEYVKSLEELQTRNPSKWKIFGLGEWGSDPEGRVLLNWYIEDFDVMELAKTCEHRAGSDEGFVDPSTIVDTLYDKANNTIYIFNEFCKTGLQLNDIADAAIRMNLKHTPIYCDSAAPRLIDFLKGKGLNAKPCIKGQGSVDARIAFLLNNKIIVHRSCKSMIESLENFSYSKDKLTGKYIEGKYEHEFSHMIDSLGYAYSDIYTKHGLRTLDKSILGL